MLATTLKIVSSQLFTNCPHCCSTHTTQLQRTTDLGYAMFRVQAVLPHVCPEGLKEQAFARSQS